MERILFSLMKQAIDTESIAPGYFEIGARAKSFGIELSHSATARHGGPFEDSCDASARRTHKPWLVPLYETTSHLFSSRKAECQLSSDLQLWHSALIATVQWRIFDASILAGVTDKTSLCNGRKATSYCSMDCLKCLFLNLAVGHWIEPSTFWDSRSHETA